MGRKKTRTPLRNDQVITVLAPNNPKVEGTAAHDLFAQYQRPAMTVGDYLAAVAKLPRRSDCGRTALWWDLDRGLIRIDEHGAVTEQPPDSRIKPTAVAHHPVRNSPRRLADQAGCNQVVRAVYLETRDFYKRIKPELKDAAAFGFRVLYGPPTLRPPIMFIGIRPGGSSPDPAHPDEQRTWPATSDYAESSWKYAEQLRRIYSSGFLARCAGTNESFFRGPNEATYRKIIGKPMVEFTREFCRPQIARLIGVIKPEHIVVVGLETFRRLAATAEVLYVSPVRAHISLVEVGLIDGTHAVGIPGFSMRLYTAELEVRYRYLSSLETGAVIA